MRQEIANPARGPTIRLGKPLVVACLIVVASLPALSSGHSSFQELIPNGDNVFSEDNTAWPGVGHNSAGGGGSLNSFGEDFRSAGESWTTALCQMDSDGDGMTNGEELGDPDCVWTQGDTPTRTEGITHPGVANTVSTDTSSSSTCEDYEVPSGASEFNITMPSYSIPSDESTYAMYLYDEAPEGMNYITQVSAITDQTELVETMRLYDCEDTTELRSALATTGPSDSMGGCTNLIFTWATGGEDFCMPADVGLAFNASAGRVLVLEVHYDNTASTSGLSDSSGFQVTYLTEDVVSNDFQTAAWGWVGAEPTSISIPAQTSFYEISASKVLPSGLPDDGITVFATMAYARTLATKVWMTVTPSDDASEAYLASCYANYDFDLQDVSSLDTSINLTSGDRVTVHCVYDTSEVTSTTNGGESSSDEMCVGMFLYYPQETISLEALSSDVSSSSSSLSLEYDSSISCESESSSSTADAGTSFSDWISGAPWQLGLHAMMMFVAWIILVPGATLLPLLFKIKGSRIWFLGHEILVALAMLLTLVAFIVIVVYKKGNNFQSTHGKLGLAIIIIVFAHLVLAMVRPDKEASWRTKWEWAHHLLGRALIILGLTNVLLGISQYELYYMESDSARALSIASIVLIVVLLVFTAVMIVRRRLISKSENPEKNQKSALLDVEEQEAERPRSPTRVIAQA